MFKGILFLFCAFACFQLTFASQTSDNVVDSESQKLQSIEAELVQSKISQKQVTTQVENYAKDSLRILMVKLISVKELEEKGLLEQDISKNSDFYLALLNELKESEIPIEKYQFLEKRLAFITQEIVEEKYEWSKSINYILGFLLFGLIAFLVLRKRKEPALIPLSRQEQNVQNLIVQGKTNKEIASELFISTSTVKSHITNIYGKLNIGSRQELLQKTQN